MAKQRSHNEWFTTVSLGNRKSCPLCKTKLEPNESIWSWGNYVCAKWRTIKHFCKNCYVEEVLKPLTDHTDDCGCTVQLIVKGGGRPEWLKLPEPAECAV